MGGPLAAAPLIQRRRHGAYIAGPGVTPSKTSTSPTLKIGFPFYVDAMRVTVLKTPLSFRILVTA